MSFDTLLLRLSIWPAVGLGLAACLGWRSVLAWRMGASLYCIHVAAAFHHVYHWSHAAAVSDNVQQVRETLGFHFNAGIWINYAFSLSWLISALTWPRLPSALRRCWIAVFLFITFQGTVVFAHTYGRWIGLALFIIAGGTAGWRSRRMK